MASLCVTPDTGATIDVIREDVAIKVGATIEPNSSGYKLIDAQKSEIHIVGTCRLWIQRPGGCWRTVIAMVTRRLSDALLLSWSTQKFLGILPPSWPWELHARSAGLAPRKLCSEPNPVKIDVPEWPPPHLSSRMREICEIYSDVLVDELKCGEKMWTPPMDVRLHETINHSSVRSQDRPHYIGRSTSTKKLPSSLERGS